MKHVSTLAYSPVVQQCLCKQRSLLGRTRNMQAKGYVTRFEAKYR
jgi:hypothetical protein